MNGKKPKPSAYVAASAPFNFVYGRFNLSAKWAIPYFATTMTMRQAADSLRLVNDFPGNESLAWKLDELYQRDIDWGRVEREIVPYLSSSEEPQFFNSLTIAFMPIKDNEAKPDFSGGGWSCPDLPDPSQYSKQLQIGPIRLGFYADWESADQAEAQIGQIRWNPQQVFSVAIDGQHRLAAIKAASTGFDERVDKTRVPVLLLLLDEKVGFRAPAGNRLVELMRTLFIALNKHSEPVSRPRQILLDDQDPHALCVRALVGDRITTGTSELQASRLPLTLVDWHGEQAKVDDGPYITTILGLDWIVEKTLNTKPIRDYSDYGAVSKQLRAISLSLTLDLHRPGTPTFDRLKEIEKQAVEPFRYLGSWAHEKNDGELGSIVEAFRKNWAGALLVVLTKFAPYEALIELRRKEGSLSSEFTNWYYLLKRKEQGSKAIDEYNNFVNRLKNRKQNPINKKTFEDHLERIERLKDESLAFKVAFQRALIRAFIDFVAIDSNDLPDMDEEDNEEAGEDPVIEDDGISPGVLAAQKRARQFVKALNKLVTNSPQFLDVKGSTDKPKAFIWHGSLYNRGSDTIDFTLGASRRAADLIFIAAAFALCEEQKDEAVLQGFDAFWDGLTGSDAGVHKKIARAIDRRFAVETGAGGRITLERGDYEVDAAREEARIRAEWIWKSLGMPGGQSKKKKKG